MLQLGKSRIFTTVKEYFLMTVGMFCYAFGWIGCILPAKCMGGGASGLSLLIYYATGETISIGVMVFIINAILLLIAGFIVGWKFGIKTIFCVCMLSFAMSTMQNIFTLPDGTIMDIFHLNDRLLSAILGGIFSGVGVAMSFAQGGSTGGVDIVAMIINKYRTVSYGKIVRAIDSVIIGSALLLPAEANIGIDGVIYGFVMTVVFSYVVDMLMTGNQQSNQIMIVCQDYKAMADAMNNTAQRGATVLDAKGWYTKNQHNIVMVVCRKRDTPTILKIAKAVDPNAFITVGSVMGVYGKGFDALNKI
ncbi:MAG: YitT family protein [Alistipes sp.]|nr:YitT family protein [Alistipes sp.]